MKPLTGVYSTVGVVELVEAEPNALEAEELDSSKLDVDLVIDSGARSVGVDHFKG